MILLPTDTFQGSFKEVRPDIVHLHNIKRMTFAPLMAAKKLGISVVFSIYDNWSFCPENCLVDKNSQLCKKFHGLHCLNCVPVKKKPFILFRKQIFDHFLKEIDGFAVLTRSERDNFIKNGISSDKIHLLPLPLFSDTEVPPASSDKVMKNNILFVGRLEFGKGLHVLGEALSSVMEKLEGMKVQIISKHSGGENCKKWIKARTGETQAVGQY